MCRGLSFAYRPKYRVFSKDSRKIAEYGVAHHKGKSLVSPMYRVRDRRSVHTGAVARKVMVV